MTQADIKSKLQRAIGELLCKEAWLLECDANERSITHKLAEYLQAEFCEWHVDCEYNRDGHDSKRLSLPSKNDLSSGDTNARTVFPDIIIHHRGTKENLLVIEVKKSTNNAGDDWDRLKLGKFKSELFYRFPVFVRFYTGAGQRNYDLEWL